MNRMAISRCPVKGLWRKLVIWERYLLTENYAETAKVFCFNESTAKSIVQSFIRTVKLPDKGNHSGAGRLLTYPKEEENGLVAWILQLLDLHVSVSVLSLQEKAKKIMLHSVQVKNELKSFLSKRRLSLRNCTSVSQKLQQQLEGCLSKFYDGAGRYMRIGKYPRSLIGNMDETLAFFDMFLLKVFVKLALKNVSFEHLVGIRKMQLLLYRLLYTVKCYLQWLFSNVQQRKQCRSYAFVRNSLSKLKRTRGWMSD